MTEQALLDRLDRIESILAIQQLPMRYALAVDSRDIDGWLALFIEDVDCGRRGRGREALRSFIEPGVRTFYRCHHQVCGHAIDFTDPDHATGMVYGKAEHERGDRWIAQAFRYDDVYERRDGRWYFVRRKERFLYSADVLERPQDVDFQRWPGGAPGQQPAMLPERTASWIAFWNDSEPEEIRALTKAPL